MFFMLRSFLTRYYEKSLFMMILPLTTGEKIKIARQRKELKQSTLAKRLGIHQNTLHLYESDSLFVSAKILPALCRELGISSDYLLGISNLNITIESSD